MANTKMFSSAQQKKLKATLTRNKAGGLAYSLQDKEALAQMIMTGTFNNTFYTTGKEQLETIKELLNKLGKDNCEFIAKLAIHARESGYMKDTPAFLLAWLSANNNELFKAVFERVVSNGKMLRNFVQIMRSGQVGRKSLGTAPKKKVQQWLNSASNINLIRASVGNSPSLADILKMVHPTPKTLEQNSIFKWVISGDTDEHTPKIINDLIDFRNFKTSNVPPVPFELLTSQPLNVEQWTQIAQTGGWHMLRMNLNTFMRNGLFNYPSVTDMIAKRLADPNEIAKAHVMPYQIFTTYLNIDGGIPKQISDALAEALNYSLETVPKFPGKTYVFVDVSGSMGSPVTGTRKGATTKMRYVDVAALFASSLLKSNPNNTEIVMFDTRLHNARLSKSSSVMKNAKSISKFGGGGTACQLPMIDIANKRAKVDQVIYISDNESWYSTNGSHYYGSSKKTELVSAWNKVKQTNPKAKLICIDISPSTTAQAFSDNSVLNVGGFNDSVFDVIDDFIRNPGSGDYWSKTIEETVTI
jgi:60 kDa SS-A/Ro ribonucleoprotein